MNASQQYIQASILDRLIDKEPKVPREPVQLRLINISQIKSNVARDLEHLLNSRRRIDYIPSEYKEVTNSVITYGLSDFTYFNPKSPASRQKLRQEVERTIVRFEPRLKNLTVQFDVQDENSRNVRFRITALLVIDPIAEPVTFDTFFDVGRGQYMITQ